MSTTTVTTVVLPRGPGWMVNRSRRDQPGRDAHAAFMVAPTDTGAVLFGSPTGDGTDVLLVVNALAERETVHRILAPDP